MNHIYLQLLTLGISAIPFSLLIIKVYTKFFSKYSPHLADITTLCTPIVGSLTQNIFSVKTVIFNNYKAYNYPDSNILDLENLATKENKNIPKTGLKDFDTIELMATVTSLCHYEKLQKIEEVTANFFKQCELFPHILKQRYEIIAEVPSNTEKKISSIVAVKKDSQDIFAFNKGNPKNILDRCSRMLFEGKKIELNPQLRRKLRGKIKKINQRGEKIIGFAYKPLPKKRLEHYTEKFTENDLVFLGFIGLGDSINTELIPTIQDLKENNIKIYVLAKDIERKTLATAQQLNIINSNYFESITGSYLEDLNDQKLEKMLSNKEKDYVFSEINDEQKNRILKTLQSQGEIIAVAEKNNQSLKNILKGIKNSKRNKINYKKLRFHALTCKVTQFILTAACIIFQAPLALTITLIITIDLIINLPLELALKAENFKKAPTPNYLSNGIFASIFLGSLYFWQLIRFGWHPGENLSSNTHAILSSTTITFIFLVLIQIGNSYKSFKNNKFKHKYLNLTAIITVLLVYILTHLTILQNSLGLNTLTKTDFYILLFTLIIYFLFETIRTKLTANRISENQGNSEKQ